MHRRKFLIIAAVIAALAIPVAALAADLHNGQGSSCPAGSVGTYHFVNNHLPSGTAPGTLTADFSDGTVIAGPSKVLNHVQQFDVESTGTLNDASTDLPGMLVLSDFYCTPVKKK
jgi:hypothetical protein